MFYISSECKSGLIGVTDTSDGVEEFYKSCDLIDLIRFQRIKIYGASVYDNKLERTVLEIDKVISAKELGYRLDNWKKVHNPWTGIPVENYLAEAQIGTAINVAYHTKSSDGRLIKGTSRIEKQGYDSWSFYDEGSVLSGRTGDNSFAHDCLEVSCIYCKPVAISVANNDGNFEKVMYK